MLGTMAQRRTKSLGDAATAVLAVLADGDRHGYAILSEVRDLTDGGVRLGTGTLYGALDRLQEAGLVTVACEEVVEGRLRRYYHLTATGRTALTEELDGRARLLSAARRRLAGAS